MFFIKQDLRRKRADELDAMIVSEDNPGSEREESFYSSHGPRVTWIWIPNKYKIMQYEEEKKVAGFFSI